MSGVRPTLAEERDNGLPNRATVAERDSTRDEPVPETE